MDDETMSGMSGADEPLVWGMKRGETTEDGEVVWKFPGDSPALHPTRPKYYYPDGSPIVGDQLMPDFMRWAMLFEHMETKDRVVGCTTTLYGEKLSTVWVGLDQNFGPTGPPLIYETMLFAPDRDNVRRRAIQARCDLVMGREADQKLIAESDAFDAYIAKHYPDDQLQLRYSTRAEAEDSHEKLRLQCLIPPRWRHLLCWTIGQDRVWRHYDDEEPG